jgi:hypothetical protein
VPRAASFQDFLAVSLGKKRFLSWRIGVRERRPSRRRQAFAAAQHGIRSFKSRGVLPVFD